jgi:putative tryptophan/tyrosine transport system substrate-binding protein
MKKFLFALCLLALAGGPFGSAAAQTVGKTYRIGYVTIASSSAPVVVADMEGLTRGLKQRGFAIGSNLVIESRFAEGKPDRLPALVKELLDSRVDALVTASYPAARAAKDATSTVPIVVNGAGDAIEAGLVTSLSRPGGNLTGISDMASELSTKRLELLKLAVPSLNKVAMLWNAKDLGMTTRYRAASAAASALAVSVQSLGVGEPDDFDTAFAAMDRDKPDGILMVSDVLTNLNRKRVLEFAAARRLPAIYEVSYIPREGGLMSYGAERSETSDRVADLVARILKGSKPADLPFEQPTRFRFLINRRTADALGFAIPETVFERADEVIE